MHGPRPRPSQTLRWLGFILDLESGQISVPKDKISALYSLLKSVISQGKLKAKLLASILGKIASLSLGVGPVNRLMTHSLYALLNTHTYWYENLLLSEDTNAELLFWVNNLNSLNGQAIWHSPSALRVVYSNASDIEFGGFTVEHGYHMAQGLWDH